MNPLVLALLVIAEILTPHQAQEQAQEIEVLVFEEAELRSEARAVRDNGRLVMREEGSFLAEAEQSRSDARLYLLFGAEQLENEAAGPVIADLSELLDQMVPLAEAPSQRLEAVELGEAGSLGTVTLHRRNSTLYAGFPDEGLFLVAGFGD